MKSIKLQELINFAERFNLMACNVEEVVFAYKVNCLLNSYGIHTAEDVVAALYHGNAIEGPISGCYDSTHNKSFTGFAIHAIIGNSQGDDYEDEVTILLTEQEFKDALAHVREAMDMMKSAIMDAE